MEWMFKSAYFLLVLEPKKLYIRSEINSRIRLKKTLSCLLPLTSGMDKISGTYFLMSSIGYFNKFVLLYPIIGSVGILPFPNHILFICM